MAVVMKLIFTIAALFVVFAVITIDLVFCLTHPLFAFWCLITAMTLWFCCCVFIGQKK